MSAALACLNTQYTLPCDLELLELNNDNFDLEGISTVINSAYWEKQQYFFIDTPLSRTRIKVDELKAIINDPHQKLFVVIDKTKEVVGTILLELPPQKDFAKFGLFSIKKGFTGLNLGAYLVDFVESQARDLKRKNMVIEVFTFAKKLSCHYQKLGYNFTGKTYSFFHEDCIKPEYQDKDKRFLQEMSKLL